MAKQHEEFVEISGLVQGVLLADIYAVTDNHNAPYLRIVTEKIAPIHANKYLYLSLNDHTTSEIL